MKLSFLSTILSGFQAAPADIVQFIDFWTENDVFALQIQRQFSTEEEGTSFWSHYRAIRGVMEFYQNHGDCDYFFQNPSFELVEEKE